MSEIYEALLAGVRADELATNVASLTSVERDLLFEHLSYVREEVAATCVESAREIDRFLNEFRPVAESSLQSLDYGTTIH